jgi:hypothetical protein
MNPREKDEKERQRSLVEQDPGSCDTHPQEEDRAVGTFGGEEDHVVRTRGGKPVPSDTGDQGGGQN